MADIHQFTKDPINAKIEALPAPNESRGYLGISQIGHECPRHIWYVYYGAPKEPVTQRTLRIWERGNWEEDRVIKDLEAIGITITHRQRELETLEGKIKGHPDGIASNLPMSSKPHLLEIKTMNDASWKQAYKQGIKAVNTAYYVQANVYAHALQLQRVLFCSVNKNTEERCFERWHTDVACVTKYIIRTAEILLCTEPPDRIGGPTWYTCKLCAYRGICHDR